MRHRDSLPEYEKKRTDYKTDLEQFRDLILNLNQHKQTLQAKIEERSAELNKTNAKLERMQQHISDLKQTIATQTLSVDDLTKLQTEYKGIQEAAERTQRTLQQRKQALHVVDTQMAQYLTQLDVAVAEYNNKLNDLATTLGATSQQWKEYKIHNIHKEKADSDEGTMSLLGVDLDETVRPKVQQYQQKMQQEITNHQREYEDVLDESNALARAAEETQAKLNVLLQKAAKAADTLEQEKQAHAQKQSVRQREVTTLEQKVASLRDPVALEEQMAAFRQQCASLEADLAHAKDEHIRAVQDTQRQIQQAVCLMQEHEAYVEAKLQELTDYWQQQTGNDDCGGLQPLEEPSLS